MAHWLLRMGNSHQQKTRECGLPPQPPSRAVAFSAALLVHWNSCVASGGRGGIFAFGFICCPSAHSHSANGNNFKKKKTRKSTMGLSIFLIMLLASVKRNLTAFYCEFTTFLLWIYYLFFFSLLWIYYLLTSLNGNMCFSLNYLDKKWERTSEHSAMKHRWKNTKRAATEMHCFAHLHQLLFGKGATEKQELQADLCLCNFFPP